MSTTSDILAAFDMLCREGKPAALATVVAVSGSAYRRPGARMLIAEDGRSWGGVSGGCLERDVIRRSRGVIASVRPVNCRYETTDDDDLVSGVATGCRGTVDLFLEPLSQESPGPMAWLARAQRDRVPVNLATIIRVSAGLEAREGMRLVIGDDGAVEGEVFDPRVRELCIVAAGWRVGCASAHGIGTNAEQHPIAAAYPGSVTESAPEGRHNVAPGASLGIGSTNDVAPEGRKNADPTARRSFAPPGLMDCSSNSPGLRPGLHSAAPTGLLERFRGSMCIPNIVQFRDGTATADVFVERLSPPPALLVFGAGPDAVPVVSMAKTLGWHVTVVGVRPATGLGERFAGADVLQVTPSDDPWAGVEMTHESAVVLMTHNYPRDLRILAGLTAAPCYLGILGPRARTHQIMADLGDRAPFAKDAHFPVGLDLGAETSEEIALAIVAEIQSVLRSTTPGFLRDRDGPIHVLSAGFSPCS